MGSPASLLSPSTSTYIPGASGHSKQQKLFLTKIKIHIVIQLIIWFYCHPKNYLSSLWLSLFNWRQWHPTPVFLPGKSRGQRSLVGCSPWGRWGSDTTERLHFDFSLSCIGEGHGKPLQCSCLENPRDGGAWWAAVYGVAQSRTRLKWLSSSRIKNNHNEYVLSPGKINLI